MKGVAISLLNINKNYNNFPVFEDFTLEIPINSITGLIGPNGSGKSTFFNMIMGFTHFSTGKIFAFDQLIAQNSKYYHKTFNKLRNSIVYAPDKTVFYEHLSIVEYLEFIAIFRDINPELIEERINFLIVLFNLNRWKYKLISTLSKGNRQRLLLASLFIGSPRLIMLDEPFNNLDNSSRDILSKIVRNYNKCGLGHVETDQPGTVVLSSHLLSTIDQVCSNLAVLDYYGQLAISGPIQEVKKDIIEDGTLEDVYAAVIEGKKLDEYES